LPAEISCLPQTQRKFGTVVPACAALFDNLGAIMTTQLNNRDLNRVLRNLPKDVRDMLKENPGMLVGGGFIRAIVCGEKPSDIDCFGSSQEQLKAAALKLQLGRYCSKLHETKNAIRIFAPPRFPVQFITRWLFSKPEDALASFDFTIAMSLIWWDADKDNIGGVELPDTLGPSKGWCSATHPDFYADLAAKRLVYTHPQRNEDAGGSLMRVRKFLERGYNIQAQSLAGAVARLVLGVSEDRLKGALHEDESYEKTWTRVLTALLREVDPLLIVDGVDPDDSQPPEA